MNKTALDKKPHTITIVPEEFEQPPLREPFQRNAEWLDQHWHLLDDRCYGKFVAASEGEIFIAENPQAAEDWAKKNHPNDVPYITYVLSNAPARIYSPRIIRK